jgi:hypothetical protein
MRRRDFITLLGGAQRALRVRVLIDLFGQPFLYFG